MGVGSRWFGAPAGRPGLGWLSTAQHKHRNAPAHNPALERPAQNLALALRAAALGCAGAGLRCCAGLRWDPALGLRWRWAALALGCAVRWLALALACAGRHLRWGCAGAGLRLRWQALALQGWAASEQQALALLLARNLNTNSPVISSGKKHK